VGRTPLAPKGIGDLSGWRVTASLAIGGERPSRRKALETSNSAPVVSWYT